MNLYVREVKLVQPSLSTRGRDKALTDWLPEGECNALFKELNLKRIEHNRTHPESFIPPYALRERYRTATSAEIKGEYLYRR